MMEQPAAQSPFPPRERGWSQFQQWQSYSLAVSPARAGMVRAGVEHLHLVRSFPRASGDGPLTAKAWRLKTRFPPRERGWSLDHVGPALAAPVSPARAGMVPWPRRRPSPGSRFPRASGDGPWRRRSRPATLRFPPRERGWSPGVGLGEAEPLVSPARAGMVPEEAAMQIEINGFPRASGDGPWSAANSGRSFSFPPRERGWSLKKRRKPLLHKVSPARAGMVPGHRPCPCPP